MMTVYKVGDERMIRLRFQGNRVATIEVAPIPAPTGNDVLVRVHASGLCGSDLHSLYRSEYGSPVTPGHEIAGEVCAIDRTIRFLPGDRVAIHCAVGCDSCPACRSGSPIYCESASVIGFTQDGGDATFVLVPERACLRLPDDVTYEVGALIGDGIATPYHALRRVGGLERGAVLGVFGLGPIGLGMTMLGAHLGATVVGIDTNPERCALAEKLGAAYVIDPQYLDPVEEIAALTSGDGLDVAAECAGSGTTLSQALGSLGYRGRLVLIGENAETTLNSSRDLIDREATIVGSRYYQFADYDNCLRLIRSGLRPERMVTHRFGLSEAVEAFRLFDGGHSGKVMLVSEETVDA